MPALARQASDVRINEVALPTLISQNSSTVLAAVYVSDQGPVGPTFYSTYESVRDAIGNARLEISYDGYCLRDYFRDGSGCYLARAITSSTAPADVPHYGTLSLGVAGSAVVSPGRAGALVLTPGVSVNPKLESFGVSGTSNLWPESAYGTNGQPLYLLYYKRGPSKKSGTLSVRIRSRNLEAPVNVDLNGISTATGLLVPSTTYRYGIAAINQNGQVFSMTTVSMTLPASKNSTRITWSKVPDAYGYVILGRQIVSSALNPLAVVGSATLMWDDTGTIPQIQDGSQFPNVPSKGYSNNQDPALPNSQRFTLDVFDSSVSPNQPVESIECSVNDQVDETSSSMEAAYRINTFSQYLGCISNTSIYQDLASIKMYSSTNWTASAAAPSTVATTYTATSVGTGRPGATPTAADINTAWESFANKEVYPYIDVLTNNGRAVPSIQQKMTEVATRRGDCIAFLDAPQQNQSAQSVLDYRLLQQNINSSYAAMFCSDLLEEDPVTARPVFVPPSGAMAGLLARTTRTSYPYRSMAGLNRGLVQCLDIRNKYEEADATRLVQSQINYMRRFLGRGTPLWEQFTLSSAQNALQFINVRVLCNVLKRSMYEFLLGSLQEPGDDILRRQIKYGLEQYLSYIKGTRGISDFKVIINSTNNPSVLVNSGVLQISVYIVPVLAVRAINLTLVVGAEGITLTETEIATLSA